MSTDRLEDQLEELIMMQRVDQELSSTLNLENVMVLTMDWALRRTGASTGMLSVMTADGTGLQPLVALGYPSDLLIYDVDHPLPLSVGSMGKAAANGEILFIPDLHATPDYLPLFRDAIAQLVVPIEMRGRILGIINLESDQADTFTPNDISFIQRLASRAAIALDNARLYEEAEHRADEMAALYSASRLISSSLERAEVLSNAAQAIAAVLNISSVVILDYHVNTHRLSVATAYRLGTARGAPDVLPTQGTQLDLTTFPELDEVIGTLQTMTLTQSAVLQSPTLDRFMTEGHYCSLLVAPLAIQNQVLGVVMAIEGRRERRFSHNEIMLAEALASQIASALRQAALYENVRELENLKSEMIRMASHDLRGPLGSAMGYLELFMASLRDAKMSANQHEYVMYIRRSLSAIQTLIDDLLTLERIESDRQSAWADLNLSNLIAEVVNLQQDTLDLKHHALTLALPDIDVRVVGSLTQLRQAVTNLVGNAIKYTPDYGQIQVRLMQEVGRIRFEVEDNGYGIPIERQVRLFQRFYRARQPGTDHINGTGLGLSLVKTVIERHGGEVWVHSEPDLGSTFGFWLPTITGI